MRYEIDWLFKRIEQPKGKSQTYSQPVTIKVVSYSDLINSFQLLVNPRFLYYDEYIGLRIGIDIEGNNFYSPDKPQRLLPSEYQYHMDDYVGHLVLMWKCWREPFATEVLLNGQVEQLRYSSVKEELLAAGGCFIKTKIFPNATQEKAEGLFEYLVFLAIFTHDLGKLQSKWQNVMRGWQEIAYKNFAGNNPANRLLAHTDYNPENQLQQQALKEHEKKYKRPNHAVESAFLASYILRDTLKPFLENNFQVNQDQISSIAYTIMMAAGRHHSAFTKGWEIKDISKGKKIELHPDAGIAIAKSWRCLIHFFPNTLALPPAPSLSKSEYSVTEFSLTKLTPQEITYLQLYSLVVRALRLCDMRSVQLRRGNRE
ncbi:MAG: CRISPR-associated helicase Cas3 [Calothrix sp. SM1_7_51]|nr:CRISPR-associated helicase Cas3 [Calothrix sp. SM1_7_51]